MENYNAFIWNLRGLASIVSYGQQGYKSAAKATRNQELKNVFLTYVEQRSLFERQLKIHFDYFSGNLHEQQNGILKEFHRNVISINEAVNSKCDSALLYAVATAEQAALEKFELVIQNNQLAQDHLNLITNQKNEIARAIKKIEFLQQKYSN